MEKLGVIGGSGIYSIDQINFTEEIELTTPFGPPSDAYKLGILDDKEIVFLPRHGRYHTISPSEINYRANIYGLKQLGVTRIISLTACGSMRKDYKPLSFVIPDQFFDRTNQARKMSFFTKDIVAHISFADPVCSVMSQVLFDAANSVGVDVHNGGTYLNMEGPAFSTRAESEVYRKWGMDIIGMTNMAEARLAREAEMCFVTLAAVTDYDCWYKGEDSVTVDMILDILSKNAQNSKDVLKAFINRFPPSGVCECQNALSSAIITRPENIPDDIKRDLNPIVGKYF